MDEYIAKQPETEPPKPPFLSKDTTGLKKTSHETFKLLSVIVMIIDALALAGFIYMNVVASTSHDPDAGFISWYSIILAVTIGIPLMVATVIILLGYFATQSKKQ